jgi:hypothetical protein
MTSNLLNETLRVSRQPLRDKEETWPAKTSYWNAAAIGIDWPQNVCPFSQPVNADDIQVEFSRISSASSKVFLFLLRTVFC